MIEFLSRLFNKQFFKNGKSIADESETFSSLQLANEAVVIMSFNHALYKCTLI